MTLHIPNMHAANVLATHARSAAGEPRTFGAK